ncbi:hypothetical protein AGMMS49573_00800 [Endomicrobiia bacterium]|nr:hypothetical protein AGMMS49573_00800 [Endomicrobiia bacterium]
MINYIHNLLYGYDYDLFNFAAEKEPTTAEDGAVLFLFTGSTHGDFVPTTKKFEQYLSDSNCNKYINALCYSDYSIRTSYEKGKKRRVV